MRNIFDLNGIKREREKNQMNPEIFIRRILEYVKIHRNYITLIQRVFICTIIIDNFS